MRSLIEKFILIWVHILNHLVPKKENQVFFYSSPDYSDNARALFEEMKNQRLIGKYKVVWAVKDLTQFENTENITFVKHRTLKNLWFFYRSKYLIRTHSLWGNRYVKGRQKMCIAWHGMPLKSMSKYVKDKINSSDCEFLTSTSEVFNDELSISMGMTSNKCAVLGLPRNDFLFKTTNVLKELYPGFDKYVIWMPTFRNAVGYVDGKDSKFGVPLLNFENLKKVNDVLMETEKLLILKLHPWVGDRLKDINYSNIVNLRDSEINSKITLYELIGQTDALITDYSSVYIDYLLINKPICFVFDDIEEYRKSRGFVFEPVEDVMPGERIDNINLLIDWLRNFDKEDKHMQERKRLLDLFHRYKDANSSKRVLDKIGIV